MDGSGTETFKPAVESQNYCCMYLFRQKIALIKHAFPANQN